MNIKPIETTQGSGQPEELWSVVVLYDDSQTRQRAMGVCDHLVRHFWSGIEFKFQWWRSDFLEDAAMAATAAGEAASADFIVISSSLEREFSPTVKSWFGMWMTQRSGREGVLLDLTEVGPSSGLESQHKKNYLRYVARQAMLDYLTRLPPVTLGALPDSYESVATRAAQVTSVLDNILLHESPPTMPLRP